MYPKIIIVLAFLLQGCAMLNPMTPAKEVTVYVGKTTEAEAVQMFGSHPYRLDFGDYVQDNFSTGFPGVMYTVVEPDGKTRTNALPANARGAVLMHFDKTTGTLMKSWP